MLFKRRNKQPFFKKFSNLVWPRMGWKRLAAYYKHRTIRIPASEKSIASGLAFGCAISWTPTFGFHLIQCALFGLATRANWLAGFLGTAFGNPWTFPVIMLISYHVGSTVLGVTGHADLVFNFEGPLTMEVFQEEGIKIFLPTLIGGYIMAFVTYPLFYFPFYNMIKVARAARKKRIEVSTHKAVMQVTGQDE